MKVTELPASVGFWEEEIDTEGSLLTVSSMVEEVAEFPTESWIIT